MAKLTEPEDTLRSLLDSLGLTYDLSSDGPDAPTASFRQQLNDGRFVEAAAGIRVQELRFTLHDVLSPTALPAPLSVINDEWAFGHVYVVDGRVDAAISMYLGGTLPGSDHMEHTWRHLLDSVSVLGNGQIPEYTPLGAPPTVDIAEVARLARGMGVPSALRGDVLSTKHRVGDLDVFIGLYLWDGVLLNARTQFSSARRAARPDEAASIADALNRTLSYGAVGSDEVGKLWYHCLMPLSWTRVDADMLQWAMAKGVFVARELDRTIDWR